MSLEMSNLKKVFIALITNHGPGELVQVFDKAEMTFVKVQVQFF
jgi:hypothetical protein